LLQIVEGGSIQEIVETGRKGFLSAAGSMQLLT
jgi:hypothetical protein